jgi:hypothetical protein
VPPLALPSTRRTSPASAATKLPENLGICSNDRYTGSFSCPSLSVC